MGLGFSTVLKTSTVPKLGFQGCPEAVAEPNIEGSKGEGRQHGVAATPPKGEVPKSHKRPERGKPRTAGTGNNVRDQSRGNQVQHLRLWPMGEGGYSFLYHDDQVIVLDDLLLPSSTIPHRPSKLETMHLALSALSLKIKVVVMPYIYI
jgi:hypothetical protein